MFGRRRGGVILRLLGHAILLSGCQLRRQLPQLALRQVLAIGVDDGGRLARRVFQPLLGFGQLLLHFVELALQVFLGLLGAVVTGLRIVLFVGQRHAVAHIRRQLGIPRRTQDFHNPRMPMALTFTLLEASSRICFLGIVAGSSRPKAERQNGTAGGCSPAMGLGTGRRSMACLRSISLAES